MLFPHLMSCIPTFNARQQGVINVLLCFMNEYMAQTMLTLSKCYCRQTFAMLRSSTSAYTSNLAIKSLNKYSEKNENKTVLYTLQTL